MSFVLSKLSPESQLAAVATIARLGSAFILIALPLLFSVPAFDSSAGLLNSSGKDSGYSLWHPFLRWDSLYFADIARHGYRFEQELAFLPVWPAMLRVSGFLVSNVSYLFGLGTTIMTDGNLVVGATLTTILCSVLSSVVLYKSVLCSPSFAAKMQS